MKLLATGILLSTLALSSCNDSEPSADQTNAATDTKIAAPAAISDPTIELLKAQSEARQAYEAQKAEYLRLLEPYRTKKAQVESPTDAKLNPQTIAAAQAEFRELRPTYFAARDAYYESRDRLKEITRQIKAARATVPRS